LATVVIGGVISAMVMSLLVLRVLYMVFQSPLDSSPKQDDLPHESNGKSTNQEFVSDRNLERQPNRIGAEVR
jgi:cobalt-zinc-cadmium resistance protein CzcA